MPSSVKKVSQMALGLKNVVASATSAYAPNIGDGAGVHVALTVGGSVTVGAPPESRPGQRVILEIIQDGTGGRTVTFNPAYKFATAFSATGNTAGKVSTLDFIVSPTGTRSAPVLRQVAAQVPYH